MEGLALAGWCSPRILHPASTLEIKPLKAITPTQTHRSILRQLLPPQIPHSATKFGLTEQRLGMQVPAKQKSHLWDKTPLYCRYPTWRGVTPKTLQPLHSSWGETGSVQTHEELHGGGGGGKTQEKMRFYLVERRELQPELHLGHFKAAFGVLSAREAAAAGGGCSAESGERSIHSPGSSGGFKSQHAAARGGKNGDSGPGRAVLRPEICIDCLVTTRGLLLPLSPGLTFRK